MMMMMVDDGGKDKLARDFCFFVLCVGRSNKQQQVSGQGLLSGSKKKKKHQ